MFRPIFHNVCICSYSTFYRVVYETETAFFPKTDQIRTVHEKSRTVTKLQNYITKMSVTDNKLRLTIDKNLLMPLARQQ